MTQSPLTIDETTSGKALEAINVVETMRALFSELGQGLAVQPPQTVTPFPDGGDFITYLGALAGKRVFGAKLSPYLPRDDGPIITAWTALMSMETGEPLALLDAGKLTTERTGATTALAVDLLAPTDRPLTLAIVGAGAVAQAHWRHVRTLRNWTDVSVFSPSLETSPHRKDAWQKLRSGVIFAGSSEAAVSGADVVMLCTSSGTPVISARHLAPHALVTSISTNVPGAHEIDPAFLTTAHVYCDYKATTPSAAGDMQLAAKDHGWTTDQIAGDLADLCTGKAQHVPSDRPTYFRSIGLGLEDIALAYAVYQTVSA